LQRWKISLVSKSSDFFLVSGLWSLVTGHWILVTGFRCQVSGVRCSASGVSAKADRKIEVIIIRRQVRGWRFEARKQRVKIDILKKSGIAGF
jgi:hypothetical protein